LERGAYARRRARQPEQIHPRHDRLHTAEVHRDDQGEKLGGIKTADRNKKQKTKMKGNDNGKK
jgi:hypothetical protein